METYVGTEREALNEGVLLTFLKQTKDGAYARVDENSFPYSRLEVMREELCEDEFYYSIR